MERRSFFQIGAAALAGIPFIAPVANAAMTKPKTQKMEILKWTLKDGEIPILKDNFVLPSGEVLQTTPDMVFNDDGKNIVVILDKKSEVVRVYLPGFEIAVEGPQSEEYLKAAVQKAIEEKLACLAKLGCYKALICEKIPMTTLPCNTEYEDGRVIFTNVAIAGWRE